MNYFVIVICVIAIVIAIIFKINNISMVLPTLIVILAIILDIVVNTIAKRKHDKESTNLEEIKESVKNKKSK